MGLLNLMLEYLFYILSTSISMIIFRYFIKTRKNVIKIRNLFHTAVFISALTLRKYKVDV